MLCSQCGRDNQANLEYCDYCGEALAAAVGGKRKTEMDGGGGGAGKRKTAMEPGAPPARNHFEAAMSGEVEDPFAPTIAPAKPRSAPLGPAVPAKKRVTQFDQGDPFAPPVAADVSDERDSNRRIVGFLITFDGHVNGKHWLIREGRNLVGRDTDRCDIVIAGDDKVSSQHAVLVWRNGRLRVADDKSQNGTFMNEEDVLQPEEVPDGAVIRIGRTRLICRLLDPVQVDKLWKSTDA